MEVNGGDDGKMQNPDQKVPKSFPSFAGSLVNSNPKVVKKFSGIEER